MDAKNENIIAPRKSSFVLIVNALSALIFQNFSAVTTKIERADQYSDQPFSKKFFMVPRPRIELGTRGFSVPCSTD